MDLGNHNCRNLIGFHALPAVPALWAVRKYEKWVFLRDGGVTPSLAPDRAAGPQPRERASSQCLGRCERLGPGAEHPPLATSRATWLPLVDVVGVRQSEECTFPFRRGTPLKMVALAAPWLGEGVGMFFVRFDRLRWAGGGEEGERAVVRLDARHRGERERGVAPSSKEDMQTLG